MKQVSLALDEEVVEEAKRITGIDTRHELIDHALKEILRRHEIGRLMELKGAVDWEGDLDEMRSGRELCEC